MTIFNLLAEMNIKKWLAKRETEPTESLSKTETPDDPDQNKTYEGHLLNDIKGLIEKASTEEGEARARSLSKANDLQIQLLVSLENEGHFLLAKKTEAVILQHKMKCLNDLK